MKGIAEIRGLVADNVRAYEETAKGSGVFREVLRYLQYPIKRGSVELVEDGCDATLSKINLINLSNDGIVLKPDNFGVRFFKTGAWNKAVDYLVLTNLHGNDYAIFIDLKSSLNDKPSALDNLLIIDSKEDRKKELQFNGAEALFDYLKVIIRKTSGSNALPDFEVRKWIFYEEVKPRSGVQSTISLTAEQRKKSQDVLTKQVSNFSTVDVSDLI